ncbi:hypothetical protein C8R47DRAFT_1231530 [Mycena vitilis]|nr:hypothetical protein C8R47DRAFT_1231530 [Mycena vitilis]
MRGDGAACIVRNRGLGARHGPGARRCVGLAAREPCGTLARGVHVLRCSPALDEGERRGRGRGVAEAKAVVAALYDRISAIVCLTMMDERHRRCEPACLPCGCPRARRGGNDVSALPFSLPVDEGTMREPQSYTDTTCTATIWSRHARWLRVCSILEAFPPMTLDQGPQSLVAIRCWRQVVPDAWHTTRPGDNRAESYPEAGVCVLGSRLP